ncbi:Ig-like domain-containing protein [Sulfurovum sp. NBC37-1]|uniref:Ig-like domain-containing protein n=1 Tax=Sulfurovum sp. (strain NBC37-1) TaxID=387093 RepID=UPI0001587DBD|nr:Ig-like domain-containing protein [Sulfurovum sp. NBC37-1]BAF73391.1 hypothetical protein SUN_2457 [Sulfurovum sp. NBC37-1]
MKLTNIKIITLILAFTMSFFFLSGCGTGGISSDHQLDDGSDGGGGKTPSITTIQITPSNVIVPKGTTGQYKAIAYYSDNTIKDITPLATWKSEDNSIVEINVSGEEGGFAKAVEIGRTTVSATYNEIKSNTATVEVTAATLESLSLTPIKTTVPKGISVAYKVIGLYSDGSSSDLTQFSNFESTEPSIATIESQGMHPGVAHTLNIGTTKIYATFSTVKSNQGILIVTAARATGLQVTPADTRVPKGTTGTYTAVMYFSDNTSQDITNQATWVSGNSSIVDIVTSGITAGYAQALNIGKTTIKASYKGIQSNTAQIEVTEASLKSIYISPIVKTVPMGIQVQYSAIGIFSDNTSLDLTRFVKWKSSDTSVAVINSSSADAGMANTLNLGTSIITATFKGIVSNNATLNVIETTIQSIQITPAEVTVPTGTEDKFTAIAYYSDGSSHDVTSQATWISDNTDVVSIVPSGEDGGLGHALKHGTANITATLDGKTSNTAVVTVTGKALTHIHLVPAYTVEIPVGGHKTYKVWAYYDDSTTKDVTAFSTLSIADTSIATIGTSGEDLAKVTGINAGSTLVKASYKGKNDTAPLTVTAVELQSIQITPAEVTVPTGTEDKFTAIAYYSDGSSHDVTSQATWISDNTDVVSIVPSGEDGGLGHALKHGTANITATLDGKTSNTAVVTVTGKALTHIHLVPAYTVEIPVGGHKTYKVWAYYDDSTTKDVTAFSTLSIADTSIATIGTSGEDLAKVTGINAGSTLVKASYKGKNDTAPLTVTAVELQSIQITPAEVTVPTGTEDKFTAIAYYSDGSSHDVTSQATWISDNTDVVSIVPSGEDGGLGHALKHGTANITATLDGKTSNTAVVTVEGKIIKNVQITPNNITIPLGTTQQYEVTVIYEDSTVKNVTDQVHIQSLNTKVAVIDTDNRAEGISTGTAELTVTFQGIKSEREFLHVSDAE